MVCTTKDTAALLFDTTRVVEGVRNIGLRRLRRLRRHSVGLRGSQTTAHILAQEKDALDLSPGC